MTCSKKFCSIYLNICSANRELLPFVSRHLLRRCINNFFFLQVLGTLVIFFIDFYNLVDQYILQNSFFSKWLKNVIWCHIKIICFWIFYLFKSFELFPFLGKWLFPILSSIKYFLYCSTRSRCVSTSGKEPKYTTENKNCLLYFG